ncbi:uncharacterized protein N7479_009193 [Penicillium vulpinum]|uniref:Uncharacterized protein n=1 Tax=Penicillium vulpinum TaxID=29845 RepID=A0A1V6RWQ1_9EURO|nr:uncharacterized protein N7479_009193 [Penicillium vulpinum]KAJ5950780.1 hypothetical protein N7479_009193 [Penicillium vulpinum]OQE05919.1 hypothetical protein PENVUL_c021G01875 [Penicillium vulpinum]
MHNIAILGGATMVALSMVPSCPAPIGLIITGLAAPLAGGLAYIGLESNIKRDINGMRIVPRVEGYPGVSQQSYDQCRDSNNGAKVTVTQTAESSFRLDGVTPECMVLAALFTSSGSLYPCGSACLQYNDLDSADVTNLQNTIQSLL